MKHSRGVVLITVIIIVAIVAIIAIVSFETAKTSNTTSYNTKLISQAKTRAQASLNYAENWLNQQSIKPIATGNPNGCSTTPCEVWEANTPANLSAQNINYWLTNARTSKFTTNNQQTPTSLQTDKTRFIISEKYFISDSLDPENQANAHGTQYYEINAIGISDDGSSSQISTAVYSQRY